MSLRVTDVQKRLGGRVVLDGASLTAVCGERVALLGENGAGKTTLLRIVAGVLAPDAGEVTFADESLLAAAGAARRQLGFVPEHPDAVPHLSVLELLRLVAALKRAELPKASMLERLGVAPLLGSRTDALSLGQRRRAFLAAALVGEPSLLVLDEPTNGLDPHGVALLGEILRERAQAGAVVLFVTHDLAFANELGARKVILRRGRIVSS